MYAPAMAYDHGNGTQYQDEAQIQKYSFWRLCNILRGPVISPYARSGLHACIRHVIFDTQTVMAIFPIHRK
jgi:hypothetical protein